ncbi:hypothetical protein [Nostoc sp. FACHB-133]|uniref:hypothetical protein n=1 Tax=Nostoc sp. FACHB-133 TaxID=2692835 RepID=UPI001684238B|nr:hypothetical protein [Nostoc sp. FACHB-133]MBD2524338.1 hypothetical protein [Nostoc sp. FACHB-133]
MEYPQVGLRASVNPATNKTWGKIPLEIKVSNFHHSLLDALLHISQFWSRQEFM